MNVRMVDLAVEAARQADLIGLVRDATVPGGSGDAFVRNLLGKVKVPVVLILNKIDRLAKPRLLPMIAAAHSAFPFVEIVPLSALDGTNVDRLERVLLERLPEGDPLYPQDYVTDQPERFFVAEIVREKVLESTRNELPFSTAVVVDRFEEADEKGLMRFYCSILVERESQKPILVGRAGEMIKRIGTAARLDLERFFQARVYLDLLVKVRSEWREDDRVLDELGLK
jgi:GTP-binding protein Era